MQINKMLFRLLTLVLILLCVTVSPLQAAIYNWQLANHRAIESRVQKDLVEFAKHVEELTEGQMHIDIMGAGQLGSWEIAQERVAMGNFAMAIFPWATAVDKRFEICNLPALIQDWEKASKNMVMGSPFLDLLTTWSEKQGLTILAPYPYYFGGIGFTKIIENPGDPTLKRGLKIRIPALSSWRFAMEGLGNIPTPINWSDVFTSLQTKVVDGVAGGGAEAYTTDGFNDVLKSYLPINSHFEVYYITVNSEMYANLPKNIQKALSDAAIALQNKRLIDGPKEMGYWENRMAEDGLVIYKLTKEEIAAYHKVIKEACWEPIRKLVGAEVFDDAIGKLK